MPPGKANRLWKLNLPYHLRNGFGFFMSIRAERIFVIS